MQALQLGPGDDQRQRSPSDLLACLPGARRGCAQGAHQRKAAAGLTRAAGGLPPGRNPDWVPPGQRKPKKPAQTLSWLRA